MAQHSGFFNAIMNGGQYDRTYNANDYSDNLAAIINNGVFRSINDDLKATASAMTVSVAAGRAWINGHYYYNDDTEDFIVPTAPTAGYRYDRIMLRLDTDITERSIRLVYAEGTPSNNPQKPAPTRSGTVYELVLCDILINANATSVSVADTRSDRTVCGWVYSTAGDNSFFESLDNSFNTWFQSAKNTLSSVTLFKRYTQDITLATASSTVQFSISQYDADTCFIEVYVNGIFDKSYTLSNNIITFDGTLTAGTVVTVNVYKSIDGTGIMTVSDEITELQEQYATLAGVSKFTYNCTGLNDNISLSQIAQAFYSGSYVAANVTAAAAAFLNAIGGNTYLAALTAEAQITVEVVGRCGITTPAAGSGTTASRYRYFNLGVAAAGTKRIIFDFAKCEKITVACSANTNNIIFYGTDLYLKNVNCYAYSNGASCPIEMIAGSNNTGNMNFESCRFSVSTSGNAIIGENGNFINCHCTVKSSAGDGLCIDAKTASLVKITGGTFYSYIAQQANRAAVLNVATNETDAVIIAHGINCPTVAVTGYLQRHLAIASTGSIYINGVCSTMTTSGTAVTVAGQIWKSKR